MRIPTCFKGPFQELLLHYLRMKYGDRRSYRVILKRSRVHLMVSKDEAIVLDKKQKLSSLDTSSLICVNVDELHGPNPVFSWIKKIVEILANGRFRVYNDISKYVELFFLPHISTCWIAYVEKFDHGTMMFKAFKTMQEFLEYLNDNLGIHVEPDIFSIHSRLIMFEDEFSKLIASMVPKPVAVLEGVVSIHGKGRRQRYTIEATLTEEDLKKCRLSVGSKVRIIVYI